MRRRTDLPSLRSGLIVTGSTLAILLLPAIVDASSIDTDPTAAHTGLYGARVTVDPPSEAYVVDNTPEAEPRYVVRYYTNTSNLSIDPSETLDQFVAFNELGNEQFRVSLKQTGCLAGNDVTVENETVDNEDREACSTITASNATVSGTVTFRAGDLIALGDGFEASGSFTAEVSPAVKNGDTKVFVTALTSSGTTSSEGPDEIDLPTGWNAIEVTWSNSTLDSEIDLCINGGSCLASGPLAHDHAGQIDYVQWGAQAVGANTSGSMDLDDFDSRRAGPIGTLP